MKYTTLPRWAYMLILLLVIPVGAGSVYLTRLYGLSNLKLLHLDSESSAARHLSIDVMLLAHIVYVFIAPMLFDTRLKWRRKQLMTMVLVIWIFEATTLYQSRVGIMISGDQVQQTEQQRYNDARNDMLALRAQAASLRETAQSQRALGRITASAATQAKAVDLEKQASSKADKLATMPTGSRLTEASIWGKGGPYKALAETLIISIINLVSLGLSGAVLRVLLEQTAPAAVASLERPENLRIKRGLGHMLRATLAALGIGAAAASAPAMAAPRPAEAQTPISASAITPPHQDKPAEQAQGHMTGASKQTHSAPQEVTHQVSTNDTALLPASSASALRQPNESLTGASEQTHQRQQGASKLTHLDLEKTDALTTTAPAADAPAPDEAEAAAAEAKADAHHKASTALGKGKKMDTGTGPNDGYRYRRAMAAIQAEEIAPGLRSIQRWAVDTDGCGIGAPTVRVYLAKMMQEGVIRPKADGRGYELVKANESQMQLQGI